jgi:thiamine biosynthesis lipoprotein
MRRQLARASFRAMGTGCALAVSADPVEQSAARLALSAAWNELRTCELVLSRFDPRSQLSELNGSAGTWMQVDERLFAALAAAVRLRRETNGRFDPTILPALVAQGYDRSFELLEARPSRTGDYPAGAVIELDPRRSRVRIERGAAVDLGGIGKGFSAGRALDAMRTVWRGLPGAIVDLGGDIAAAGLPPEGGPWLVAVENPWRSEQSLGTIALTAGGVATSGPARRRFGPDGTHHHLIDPDTGESSQLGPLAVTVVAPDPGTADAHATALAVSPDAGAYASAHPGLGALVVTGPGPPQLFGAIDFRPSPVSFEVTL